MRVKGFRYGKDHVPFGDDELELLKYECDKCLRLLAFTASSQVHRWQYMSAVDCVVPEKGDEESAKAFTAFVWGMMELNQVALCRYVARKNAKPQLVALIPDIATEGGERFFLVQLPFAEDIRSVVSHMRSGLVDCGGPHCVLISLRVSDSSDFNFANFNINPAFIPNDTQKAVAKDFIKKMNLDEALVDEEGSAPRLSGLHSTRASSVSPSTF